MDQTDPEMAQVALLEEEKQLEPVSESGTKLGGTRRFFAPRRVLLPLLSRREQKTANDAFGR